MCVNALPLLHTYWHNRQVLRAHKAALYSQRAFWKQLLHSSVPFSGITRAFSRIEATRSTADRAYKTMLERYPSNIKVCVCVLGRGGSRRMGFIYYTLSVTSDVIMRYRRYVCEIDDISG